MYINETDLDKVLSKNELIELSNDEYGARVPDSAVVKQAIMRACEFIDSFLFGRYDLPLSAPPNLIKSIACDFTRYFLNTRRVNGADIADALKQSYKNGVDILSKVRDGKLHLGLDKKLIDEVGAYTVRAKKRMDLSAYE